MYENGMETIEKGAELKEAQEGNARQDWSGNTYKIRALGRIRRVALTDLSIRWLLVRVPSRHPRVLTGFGTKMLSISHGE
jgi:hypothetical protein